jgi:hypothetical protein
MVTDAFTYADEGRMGDEPDGTRYDVVTLGGVEIPVSAVAFNDLHRFETKLTTGEYTKDSDDLMSAWIVSNLVGGIGIDEHIEGATDDRYRFGMVWSRSANQISLLPAFEEYVGLDDFPDYAGGAASDNRMPPITKNGVTYVTYSNSLFYYVSGTNTWNLAGHFTTRPVNKAELFGDRIWFPFGTAGINYYAGGGVFGVLDTTVQAEAIVRWGTRLYAVTADRYVRWMDTAFAWSAADPNVRLPAGQVPVNMTVYFDRSGELVPYIITEDAVWAVDPDAGTLEEVRLKVPMSPNFGLGATNWRDDALYLSFGIGVMQYGSNGVISAMGPDRDDGLPAVIRVDEAVGYSALTPKYISDLTSEFNALYAMVLCDRTSEDGASAGTEYTALALAYNGAGWHPVYAWGSQGSTGDVRPTSSVISRRITGTSDFAHELWTVNGPRIQRRTLPKAYFGPRQSVITGATNFAEYGYFYTGKFDAGMRGFDKIASHYEVYLTDPEDGEAMGGSVTVSYQTDQDAAGVWHEMGTADEYGRTVFPFGENIGDPAHEHEGVKFNHIEFKIELATTNTARTPLIDSLILKYIKVPLRGKSWTFTVPLDGKFGNNSPATIAEHISSLGASHTFTAMWHKGEEFRVRVAGSQGTEFTGHDDRNQMTVTCIEVPIPEHVHP